MIAIYPIIGLLFVAAITPGPNNILVMQASLQGGARSAVLAMFGVISGTMVLYLIVAISFEQILSFHPYAINIIAVVGAAYLMYLGGVIALSKPLDQKNVSNKFMPTSFKGIAAFQLLNPKAWVLVSTVIASGRPLMPLENIAFLMIIVTTLCLTCWATLGFALSKAIKNPRTHRFVNTVMGSSLILFALAIVAH